MLRGLKNVIPVCVVGLHVVGCGGAGPGGSQQLPTSPTVSVTTPTAPTPSTGPTLVMNSDVSSRYAGKLRAGNGAELDFWRGLSPDSPLSDLRVLGSDGSVVELQVDETGRPTFLRDGAGTKLWVVYLDGGQADLTIVGQSGASWRGIVDLPPADRSSVVGRHDGPSKASFLDLLRGATDLLCSPQISTAIALVMAAACAKALPTTIVAPIVAVGAIVACTQQALIKEAIDQFICASVRDVTDALVGLGFFTTENLGSPQSPLAVRPSLPLSPVPATVPPAPGQAAARDDAYSVRMGGVLHVPAPGVLSNDGGFGADPQVEFFPEGALPLGVSFVNVGNGSGGFTLDLSHPPVNLFVGTLRITYVVHSSRGDSNVAAIVVGVSP